MKRVIISLVAGLLIGGLGVLYFLGRPRTGSLSGTALRPPDATSSNAATVSVAIDEKFFDSLLATIFQQLGSPQLKLSEVRAQSPFQAALFQAGANHRRFDQFEP